MTYLKQIIKFVLFLFLLAAFDLQATGQTFAQMIARLNSLPLTQRQAVADSFMNSGQPIPMIESDTIVHFAYNSASQSVSMAGDATGWNPNAIFANIAGTTFWYYTTSYETDARLDYKFVINGSNWILDPKNPHTCTGGFGPNSELRMPGFAYPPDIAFYGSIPHGIITDTTIHSNILGNTRQVRVYLPPGYPAGSEAYPVILFHDGLDYINLGKACNILDYLISQHLVSPVIAVFVPAIDRSAEYAGSKIDNFTAFITTELMPVIDSKYKTSKDPARRAMAGASDGGNISLYIGMKHPGQFGKIAAQSSDVISSISSAFSGGPKLNLELYLDIGTYDIPILIPMVYGLRDILLGKGYAFQFHEWHEGHSWGNWMGHLRLPLMQFFPWSSGLNDLPGNGRLKLDQNRPNPFREHTMIRFSGAPGAKMELTLFDLSGRFVDTIYSGSVLKTENSLEYFHTKPAGEYILTLKENGMVMNSIIIQAL